PSNAQTKTIRIKPVNSTNIYDALKGVSIPSELRPSLTKVLKDGSKIIYTSKEEELRALLGEAKNLEVMKPVTFLPQLKVLGVPSGTDPEIVKLGLNASKSRQIGRASCRERGLEYGVHNAQEKDGERTI